MRRVLGLILLLVGLVAVFYGGASYTRREKILDLGPIEATVDRKERVPWSPVAGGVALVAGVVLLLAGRRSAQAPPSRSRSETARSA